MTADQVKYLKEQLNKDNGEGKPVANSVFYDFDNNMAFRNGNDFVIFDDANELVHCIAANQNAYVKNQSPFCMYSAGYDQLQFTEANLDLEGLTYILENMLSGLIDDNQKAMIQRWAQDLPVNPISTVLSSYHKEPKKADDSRYIHRGPFLWEEATLRHTPGTIQQRIFEGLEKMETLRKELEVFSQESSLSLKETWDSSVLCLCRQGGGQYLVSLFNFSDQPKTAWIKEEGVYQELLTGQKQEARDVLLAPYEMKWMLRKG